MMTETFIHLINQYGYLALFLFLFLQEVGAPTPIPNEIILVISGYLIYSGYLSFFGVLPVVILSDSFAALLLYGIFYFFGNWLIHSKPKWIPISTQTIVTLQKKINQQGISSVFVGRLAPFIRGYVAVVSGLTHVRLKTYCLIILPTTTFWGLFYITMGYIISPYWYKAEPYFSKSTYIFGAIFILLVLVFVIQKTQSRLFLKS